MSHFNTTDFPAEIHCDTPCRLFSIPPQTERCWNVLLLPLSLHWISYTHTFSAHLLSCILSLHPDHSRVPVVSLKAYFFSTDRIPNMDLALPYQEARTSRIRTMETPQWWFQTCCQMGQPWDDCCKLNSIIMMSSWRFYSISLNADNDFVWRFVSSPTKIDSHFCFRNLQHQRPNCHGQRNFYGERPLQPHHSHPQDMRQNC